MDWTFAEHRLRRSGHLRIDHRCSSRASGSLPPFCVLSFSQPMTPLTSRMKQNQPGDGKNHQAGGQASDQQRSKRHQRTRGKNPHCTPAHTLKVQGTSARDERELPGRKITTDSSTHSSQYLLLQWFRCRSHMETTQEEFQTWSCCSSFLPELVEAAPTPYLCSRSFHCFFSSSFCHSCNSPSCLFNHMCPSSCIIFFSLDSFLSSSIFSFLAVNGAALTVTRRHLFDNSVFGSGPLLWRYHL